MPWSFLQLIQLLYRCAVSVPSWEICSQWQDGWRYGMVASELYDYGVHMAMMAYMALCLGHWNPVAISLDSHMVKIWADIIKVWNYTYPHFCARSGGQLEINLCLQWVKQHKTHLECCWAKSGGKLEINSCASDDFSNAKCECITFFGASKGRIGWCPV